LDRARPKAEARPAAAVTQAAVIDRRQAAVVIRGPRVVAIAADQAVANPIRLDIPQDRDAAAEDRGVFARSAFQPPSLLIDSAGKVRSTEAAGKPKIVDPLLMHAGDDLEVHPSVQDGSTRRQPRLAVPLTQ